jgi:hypothetical protein
MPKKPAKPKRRPGRPVEWLKSAGPWEADLDRILRAGAPKERKPKTPAKK